MVPLMLICFLFRAMCQPLVLNGVTNGKWDCLQPVEWDISSSSLGKPCWLGQIRDALDLPTRSKIYLDPSDNACLYMGPCRQVHQNWTVDNPEQRPVMTRPFVFFLVFDFCPYQSVVHSNLFWVCLFVSMRQNGFWTLLLKNQGI